MTNWREEIRRAAVSLCSVAIALGVFGVALEPLTALARKSFHVWYTGIVGVFLAIFAAGIVAFLRGPAARSIWPVAVATVWGWISSAVAYVVYFSAFEFERFANSMRIAGIWLELYFLFVIPPLMTFSWLFGALVGLSFVCLRQLVGTRS